nr:glycosyltransferase [Lachnospiraceae bacterium]
MNKVSIIVIIYKVEKYLRQCLESLVSQSYENLELILVAGTGDDACIKICEEYEKKDDRIK